MSSKTRTPVKSEVRPTSCLMRTRPELLQPGWDAPKSLRSLPDAKLDEKPDCKTPGKSCNGILVTEPSACLSSSFLNRSGTQWFRLGPSYTISEVYSTCGRRQTQVSSELKGQGRSICPQKEGAMKPTFCVHLSLCLLCALVLLGFSFAFAQRSATSSSDTLIWDRGAAPMENHRLP